MVKFRKFLTKLSACDTSYFVSGDNFSKYQWIFTKIAIWFGIGNEQISLICDRVICPRHDNDGVL